MERLEYGTSGQSDESRRKARPPPRDFRFQDLGNRYIFFFFGHRFNGAVAREPLGEMPFALGLLSKICVCLCVCACVCWSFLSFNRSLLLSSSIAWIGIRNLVRLGGVKERFRHRLVVNVTRWIVITRFLVASSSILIVKVYILDSFMVYSTILNFRWK